MTTESTTWVLLWDGITTLNMTLSAAHYEVTGSEGLWAPSGVGSPIDLWGIWLQHGYYPHHPRHCVSDSCVSVMKCAAGHREGPATLWDRST